MRRLIKKIIFILMFMLFPLNVNAYGNISPSPTSLTIEVGSSKTFTITATNTIGDVSILSSDSNVAKVNNNEWETGTVDENQTKTGTITVMGISEGNATITLTLDAATFDGEDLSGQKRIINVKVISKTNDNNNNNNNNNDDKPNENNLDKNSNNNLKKIFVEGYELVKINNNYYTLNVPNNISNIIINAVAEDNKAIVKGTGNHELVIGENNIGITVTSESGDINKINVKVTRKEAFYLDDLDDALKDNNNSVDIIIESDTKIDAQSIEKIKDSKKTVNLNYYDNDKKLVYDWILDGSKIEDTSELDTTVTFDTENKKEISKLSNYADGLYLKFKQLNSFPKGTKIKLFVGNKFDNGDLVKIYNYINGKLELISDNIKVMNGYITFDLENVSDYFISMFDIYALDVIKTNSDKVSFNIWLIIIPIIIILVMGYIIILLRKNKNKNINNELNIASKNIISSNTNNVNTESINNNITNQNMVSNQINSINQIDNYNQHNNIHN